MKTVNYVICSAPRSGTNLLRHLLVCYGMGHPVELKDTSDNPDNCGIFNRFVSDNYEVNSRTMWSGQFRDTLPKMLETYHDIKYIYLIREDLIARAISLIRAIATKEWVKHNSTPLKTQDRSWWDLDDVFIKLEQCIKAGIDWECIFNENNITPLVIVYENLCENMSAVLENISDFLNITPVSIINKENTHEIMQMSGAPAIQRDAFSIKSTSDFKTTFDFIARQLGYKK